jgi:hypothetical protein
MMHLDKQISKYSSILAILYGLKQGLKQRLCIYMSLSLMDWNIAIAMNNHENLHLEARKQLLDK